MESPYVSRGGVKLEEGINTFGVPVQDAVAVDLGCSTGGFTDCLLHHGARKVYAVDTGYGVLDWKLRQDPRVVVMERTNALHVELPEPMDLVVIDAGWTKQERILPKALELLRPGGWIVTLLKTHYESLPTERVRGVVKPEYEEAIVARTMEGVAQFPVKILGIVPAPITGGKGKNQEYVVGLQKM